MSNPIKAAGYADDFSKSNNAHEAESAGRFPATKVAQKLGVDPQFIRKHAPTSGEWHHTSKFYNVTPYYDHDAVKEWLESDEGKEAKAAFDKQQEEVAKSGDKVMHDASIKHLEWGGTRNHPVAHEREEHNVHIHQKAGKSMVTVTRADGTSFKKKLDTRGFQIKDKTGKHFYADHVFKNEAVAGGPHPGKGNWGHGGPGEKGGPGSTTKGSMKNIDFKTWPDNSIFATDKTGTTTLREHHDKMHRAVSEVIQQDKRFCAPKAAEGNYVPRPYLVDILTPDGDTGEHHAVVQRHDGKLVKHAFDYDVDSGEVEMAEGEPKETERHTVYATAIEEHEETVKAAGNSEGAKKGWEKRARAKTDFAREESTFAANIGSHEAHWALAERAHKEAAEAHESAAKEYGDHDIDQREFHEGMSRHHHYVANGFKKRLERREKSKTKASDETETVDVIRCRATNGMAIPSKPWVQGKSVEFPYAPIGKHTITAGFRKNDSITIALEVDADTATELQESFDHLTATNPQQEPYADEDHEGRKATLRFPAGKVEFVAGKAATGEEAVMVKGAEPTSYGAESVNGKVYRSWSPEFSTDADYTKAEEKDGHYSFPKGVRGSASNPARITGVNFVTGALTNRPAFRAMPPVKAKEAANPVEEPVKPQTAADIMKALQKEPTAAEKVLATVVPIKSVKRSAADIFKEISSVSGGTGRP